LGLGIETAEHLMQRPERLALEAGALGSARKPERRIEALHLDVAEPGLLEQVADAGRAERAGQPGRGRRQLRALADDADRHREEAVRRRLREDDRTDAAARPQRAPLLD